MRTSGQAKSPAGVFGVTIDAMTGAFSKTRIVTIWPRFILRNSLARKVGVVPVMDHAPKLGDEVANRRGCRASEASLPTVVCSSATSFSAPVHIAAMFWGRETRCRSASGKASRTWGRVSPGSRALGTLDSRLCKTLSPSNVGSTFGL